MNKTLVLATHNRKKRLELEALVAPLGVRLLSLEDLGIPAADEPHVTFVENALAKARHAAAASGLPALADDSGLCVEALGGLPGVRSARFAVDSGVAQADWAREQLDAANNACLLERMRLQRNRRAHFICVLVAVRQPDDPEPLLAEGRWHGELLGSPQGQGGFGYDPLLGWPSKGVSVAQLSSEQKNLVSHRALACEQLLTQLRARWLPDGDSGPWTWLETA